MASDIVERMSDDALALASRFHTLTSAAESGGPPDAAASLHALRAKLCTDTPERPGGVGWMGFYESGVCCKCGHGVIEFSRPNNEWNSIIRPDGHETDSEYLCAPCYMDAQAAELTRLRERVEQLTNEIANAVAAIPGKLRVRVCEGGGPENIAASLGISLHKLITDHTDLERKLGVAVSMAQIDEWLASPMEGMDERTDMAIWLRRWGVTVEDTPGA